MCWNKNVLEGEILNVSSIMFILVTVVLENKKLILFEEEQVLPLTSCEWR
jgi:hypothetical protein